MQKLGHIIRIRNVTLFIFKNYGFDKMSDCCSKFVLLILSICSLGIIAAASGALIWAIQHYELKEFTENNNLLGIVIAVLCVSVFIFIFSIIASCSERGCLGFILGVLFLILAAGLVFCMVLIFTKEQQLINEVGRAWTDASKNLNQTIKHVEDLLKCEGWDENQSGKKTCKDAFKDTLNTYKTWVLVVLGIAAVLLLIGAILSFMKMCKRDDYDELNKKPTTVEQPLSYGW